MDELDHNLFDAWFRIFEMCKADPTDQSIAVKLSTAMK